MRGVDEKPKGEKETAVSVPELKYRHELKYVISAAQAALIRTRLRYLLSPDPHAGSNGHYDIRSLYFDDWQDRCLRENESGTEPREKFRVRIYNRSAAPIRLECKRKEHGKTLKTSCSLTEEQTRALMAGRVPSDWMDGPALLRKLSLSMRMCQLHPVVLVEYEREPYLYTVGNVRITLDANVASSGDIAGFLNARIPVRPVLPAGQLLLEVKFDGFLPDVVRRSLQMEQLMQTAFSKYALSRKYTR